VIREGRAALTTSFGVFKYMAGYSLTEFFSVSLLYWIATNMSDFMYLFIDLFLILIFAIAYGHSGAAHGLAPKPPPTQILSIPSVSSLILQIVINVGFQAFVFTFITEQPWFIPFTFPGDTYNFNSYQVTVVFLITTFQYITMVIVYSKGHPYRKSIFHNHWLCGWIVLTLGCCICLTLGPPEFMTNLLVLKMPPVMHFRYLILLLAALNFCVANAAESLVIDWWMLEKGHCTKVDKKQYEKIAEDMTNFSTAPESMLETVVLYNERCNGVYHNYANNSMNHEVVIVANHDADDIAAIKIS